MSQGRISRVEITDYLSYDISHNHKRVKLLMKKKTLLGILATIVLTIYLLIWLAVGLIMLHYS